MHLTQICNILLTWLAIFSLKAPTPPHTSTVPPAPTQVILHPLTATHREEPQIPDKHIRSTVVFPLTSEYAGMNHVILNYLPVLLLQLLVSV